MRAMGRAVVVAATALFLSCGSMNSREIPEHLEPSDYIQGCYISCPYGYTFAGSDTCRGSKRWFTNVTITGHYTNRGVDGSITTDVYTTVSEGDVPVAHTKLCNCKSLEQTVIDNRPRDKRGIHPGEDSTGEPLNPWN